MKFTHFVKLERKKQVVFSKVTIDPQKKTINKKWVCGGPALLIKGLALVAFEGSNRVIVLFYFFGVEIPWQRK